MAMKKRPPEKRGKQPRYQVSEPAPESVQSLLQSIFAGPPKKEWRYLRGRKPSKS